MTKADELWDKYSVAEMECGRNVKRVEFYAALAEYGEAVRAEAKKVCDGKADKVYPHAKGPFIDCAAAIEKMKLP